MIDIHDGQITDLLSNSLRYNPETIAIAYAVLQEKRRILDLAERTRLMAAVDTLEERTLDYLAVELRTPAYRDSFPLETKRELIKGTLPFYAKLGTPAAVDWVIQSIFENGGIKEWFEYGGEPHHFRVAIDVTGKTIDPAEIEEMRLMIYAVKRLTSWLDEMSYVLEASGPAVIRLGGAMAAVVSFPVPEAKDGCDFRGGVWIGGASGVAVSLPVPEQKEE